MSQIVRYDEQRNIFTVELTTVWNGADVAREWRARLKALQASDVVDASMAALKEMPRGKVERLTSIRGERVVEENIGTTTWHIGVQVK